MDTTTLELFMEVMQQRNFTDVARTHGLAPSSVSRCMTGLEKELGIRLFQRTTRKLQPTEAGLVYFERLGTFLGDLESARQIAADLSEEPKGTLRLTAATVFGQKHIVPLLPLLAEKYPTLAVELNLTDAYLDLVEERIDIAIRLGTLLDSSYIAKRLAPMRFYICASPGYIEKRGYPTLPHHLTEFDCLLFPRSGYSLNWLFIDKQLHTVNVKIVGKTLITNSSAIKQCTLMGMGLSLLPDWLVREELTSGTLVQLFQDYKVTATNFDSAIWLVYPSREYLPLKTRVFIDLLNEQYLHNH